jgi:hypothetical protein
VGNIANTVLKHVDKVSGVIDKVAGHANKFADKLGTGKLGHANKFADKLGTGRTV